MLCHAVLCYAMLSHAVMCCTVLCYAMLRSASSQCCLTRLLSCVLQVKNAKPGILSEELRNGLGMAEGSPPPWLINMQRYGPPPSYPELKVTLTTPEAFCCSELLHWFCCCKAFTMLWLQPLLCPENQTS